MHLRARSRDGLTTLLDKTYNPGRLSDPRKMIYRMKQLDQDGFLNFLHNKISQTSGGFVIHTPYGYE